MSEEKLQCPFCKGVFEEKEFCNKEGQIVSICKNCQPKGESPPAEPTMTCSSCKTLKGVDSFNRDSKRRSGRYPVCKDCRKSYYIKRALAKEARV